MPDWLTASPAAPVEPQERQERGRESDVDATARPRSIVEGMKVVCICKGIKQRAFWRAMEAGAQSKEEINQETGAGSGGCKGRRCGPRILEMLRRRLS